MNRLFATACLLGLCSALPAATGLDPAGQPETVIAQGNPGFTYVRLDHGLQFRIGDHVKNVILYGPATVRVTVNLGRTHTRQPSLAVIAPPAPVPYRVEESPESLTLVTDRVRVVASKRTGALTFLDAGGQVLTRERAEAPEEFKEVTLAGAPTYEVRHTFTLAPDESLYGLGQYNRRYMDYRGQDVLLVQTNIGTVVPFLLSTRRYGILWDIYSKMTFSDGPGGATLWAESAPAGIDYYLIAGGTMDGVIAGYRRLTGAAPMFPKGAYGLLMSKERYPTQERVLEVARAFRRDGFPLDFIVQDWQYWGGDKDGTWSGMIWNKERFPDPAGMIRTLHRDLHLKLMVSIWPAIGNDTALARELDAQGLRFGPPHWISHQARIYDAYSAQGRAIYFKHLKRGLLDVGVDALWMDGTEVEVGGACHNPAEVERDIKNLGRNALGDFTRYLNPYSLLTTKGAYEGQRESGEQRVFTLTRSAWAGQQRYAALPWSGDTTASWEAFRDQIAGGLNVGMAGLPYWTQDTGGFFVNYPEGERNPEYQELYARWNQFAVFNPIYRIHGTDIEREPYVFKTLAPEIYRSLLGAARLRYQLLPYLYSLAWQTTANGYTIMRGLPLDFPDDAAVRRTDDTFMFGPAFLVHPVTRAMFRRSDPPPATIPAEALRTPDGHPGLSVQYFSGLDFERPAGTAVDEQVEHAWPGPPLANPPPGLDGFENFSARWEGRLIAAEEGEHEIGAEYDDGVRIFIDGRKVVEDWGIGPKRYRSVKLALAKGQQVAIRAEFHQAGGERFFRLCWRKPSDLRTLAEDWKGTKPTQRTYLPAGADWYDFWTHEYYPGGQTVTKTCTLDTYPLYVRAGSIVPMCRAPQYATEQPDAPYEIVVYPGADGNFTLYEDDNESYAYERGQRATTELSWHDATKTLHIGARQGSFPGMTPKRELTIVLASPPSEPGRPASAIRPRNIHYTGTAVDVAFTAAPATLSRDQPSSP